MTDTPTDKPQERRSGSTAVRLGFLALALLVALLLVSKLQGGDGDETTDEPTNGRADSTAFDPTFEPGSAGATVESGGTGLDAAATVETAAPEGTVVEVSIDGTPVTDGATVSLDGEWVKGTVSRYRIVVDQTVTDRETEQTQGQRLLTWVRTEVIAVGDDGSATISLSLEDFYTHVVMGQLAEFAFDSRDPDETLLENPAIAAAVAPLRATLKLPLEFEVDASGRATAVHGVDRWQESIEEAVRVVLPDADIPPVTEASVLGDYREHLFPGVGGGELTVPETREYESARDSGLGRDVTVDGTWTVTHDDPDHFVARATGAHGWNERPGPAPTRSAARIAGFRVYPIGDPSFTAHWQVERRPFRVVEATLDASYQQWVAFGNNQDSQKHFQIMKSRTQVELLSE